MRKEVLAEGVELYLGDCREILPMLGKVDAVVTDPPYGMDYSSDNSRFTMGGRRDRSIIGDDEQFDPAPWLAFPEVILWGSNHYSQRLPVGSTLIWLKRHPENYGYFLSDAEIGWHSKGHGVYALHAPDSAGRRQKEFTGSPFGGDTAHPFQKPTALMSWCIERTKGKTVLDPYMGSGTTGIAAVNLRRNFIGIEIDPKYFDIACSRISDQLARPSLSMIPPVDPRQEAFEL